MCFMMWCYLIVWCGILWRSRGRFGKRRVGSFGKCIWVRRKGGLRLLKGCLWLRSFVWKFINVIGERVFNEW